ncbi:MAG: porin [Phycisphaerae bacterium]|nr:porin [Phycisphaerae bacterium]
MNRTGMCCVLAGAATLGLTGAVLAADSGDDALQQIEELRRENQQLAAKVSKLEQVASDDGVWLTEARAAEIKGLVTDVLADADARSSLQADGATAGWNKGFYLSSADGSFRLNIKGQVQFRWAASSRDIPDGALASGSGSGKEENWGFENRRTKLTFSGNIIDPSVTFEVKPSFNRQSIALSSGSQSLSSSDVNATVEDIWVQKAFDGGFSVRAGQFKAPFLREELVSSSSQLAVERTLVNDAFSTKFSQGVQLEYEQDTFRLQGFYGDGLRANRVNPVATAGSAGSYSGSYLSDFQTNKTNYAFAGRAELKLAGTWKQFRDLTSFRGEEFGLLLGVGGMAQSLRPTPTSDMSAKHMWGVTGDVTVDFGGANLFAYGVLREVSLAGPVVVRGGGTEDSVTQWGFAVQGGFFVTDDIELFGRYEYGDLDTNQFRTAAGSLGADLENASIITIGANVYPLGVSNRDFKWTTDVGYALDAVGDFNSSGADWLPDATAEDGSSRDGQFVIRSQIQLTF